MSKSTGVGVVTLLGLSVGLGLAPGWAAPETKPAEPTIWEYHCLNLPDGNISGVEQKWVPELNQAGADGWEVVATVPLTIRGDTSGLRVLLKRPKRSPEPAGKSEPAAAKPAGGDAEAERRAEAERFFDILDKDGNLEISEEELKRGILVYIKFRNFGISPKFPITREEFLKIYPKRASE
jgi:hypothetical protein